jgi:hypothetical protein
MEKSIYEQEVEKLFVSCKMSTPTYVYLLDLFKMEKDLRNGYQKLLAIENRVSQCTAQSHGDSHSN